MTKEAANALRVALHAAQVARSSLQKLRLRARRGLSRHDLLDLGIEQFVGVQLRAVAGQVVHFDRFAVLAQPGLDAPGMMHRQVVQDQMDLAIAPRARRSMKSINSPALSAPSKIFQRIWPRLVTVEM